MIQSFFDPQIFANALRMIEPDEDAKLAAEPLEKLNVFVLVFGKNPIFEEFYRNSTVNDETTGCNRQLQPFNIRTGTDLKIPMNLFFRKTSSLYSWERERDSIKDQSTLCVLVCLGQHDNQATGSLCNLLDECIKQNMWIIFFGTSDNNARQCFTNCKNALNGNHDEHNLSELVTVIKNPSESTSVLISLDQSDKRVHQSLEKWRKV